jgi:hypothetical protein
LTGFDKKKLQEIIDQELTFKEDLNMNNLKTSIEENTKDSGSK